MNAGIVVCVLAGLSLAAGGRVRVDITVPVAEVTERAESWTRTYPGRVTPVALANVRSQVAGEILEVCFSNGATVVQGQTLYRIDPVKYEAAVRNAEAKVAERKANLLYAEQSHTRHEKLLATKAVSRDAADSALAQRDVARANLSAAEAELASARDDLKHCTVIAPISGKAGTTAFTEGNYVTVASEPLVGIVKLQPIRVRFYMSNRDFLSMFGGSAEALRKNGKVVLKLADGRIHAETGRIEYLDNITDTRTDTICAYVIFANGGGGLKPGDGVTAVLSSDEGVMRVAVPQTAVLQDAQGAYVWVLDAAFPVCDRRDIPVFICAASRKRKQQAADRAADPEARGDTLPLGSRPCGTLHEARYTLGQHPRSHRHRVGDRRHRVCLSEEACLVDRSFRCVSRVLAPSQVRTRARLPRRTSSLGGWKHLGLSGPSHFPEDVSCGRRALSLPGNAGDGSRRSCNRSRRHVFRRRSAAHGVERRPPGGYACRHRRRIDDRRGWGGSPSTARGKITVAVPIRPRMSVKSPNEYASNHRTDVRQITEHG